MNAFVFPGQGSQKVGMGRALYESAAGAREVFARAHDILGYDLARLCLEGPAEQLMDTRYAQPALLTVGVLYLRAAVARGLRADMVAGHSLGEYTALVAAGTLVFEDALRLVQCRAELMAAAPPGVMAALIGLPDERLQEVLDAAGNASEIVAANYNAPGQVVVSGTPSAIEAAMAEAKARGAKMAVKLAVSGAFHSPLMRDAGAEMAELIETAAFKDAAVPIYQNTTAAPATAAADIKAALQAQMTSPVRWTQTIQAMIAAGAGQFYELGPGSVLAGLIKRIDKSVPVTGLE